MYEVEHFVTENGRDVVQEYLDSMRDLRAHARILRRIDRIRNGNFGDYKCLREGIYELRIDVGAAYRVYYTTFENKFILLLCAGDKKTQSSDIEKATMYRDEYISSKEVHHD